MLTLCRVTKVKVFFLVLVYVFNFDLFEFSATILEKGLLDDGIYAKLCIFNRPVQKERNLPRFLIHAVCNLSFYHSSELKVILKQERFVYFSAI